jgi:hypothetical protein
MAMHREAVKTPLTAPDVYVGLRDAWQSVWSETPKHESLCVLLAQWALETGRGKSCFNYNLGNVKSREGDGYDFTFFSTTENLPLEAAQRWLDSGDRRVRILSKGTAVACILFLPDHPGCRFRSFSTLAEGGIDYLKLLHSRFSAAWPAVLLGDARCFARELKRARYYTADEQPYGDALASLAAEFAKAQTHC